MKKLLLTMLVTLFAFFAQADLLAVDHEHKWKDQSSNSSSADSYKPKLSSSSADDYKSALKSAKSEQRKVKKLGFEWLDISKFLKSAKKKYKAGDVKGAMKLIAKAKTQALLGQQQARGQANAGPRF